MAGPIPQPPRPEHNLHHRSRDFDAATIFSRKLAGYSSLSPDDVALLEGTVSSARALPANYDLVMEGDKPGPTFVVLDGWACRYKMLPNGSRQILAFLLPGDSCDLHVSLLDRMDHSIGTLTQSQVAAVSAERVGRLFDATPTLARALGRAQLVDEVVMRAWIVNMGRRDSVERVAHLMLELYVRLRNIGLTSQGSCRMPLTQTMLADALGLTPVHLNRVLRTLRERDVMTLALGTLHIRNVAELVRIAGFDETYLHGRGDGAA